MRLDRFTGCRIGLDPSGDFLCAYSAEAERVLRALCAAGFTAPADASHRIWQRPDGEASMIVWLPAASVFGAPIARVAPPRREIGS